MNFPEILDNAKVLYYAPKGAYGDVSYPTGDIAENICYLAICKYENDEEYYLFGCNADCEVVSDSLWESAEECMSVVRNSYDCDITWIEAIR